MNYRESIIKMLMHDIDEQDLKFIYGATRLAYRKAKKKEKAKKYTWLDLDCKMDAIRLLLKIDDSERFLRQVWTILVIHFEKKGGVE